MAASLLSPKAAWCTVLTSIFKLIDVSMNVYYRLKTIYLFCLTKCCFLKYLRLTSTLSILAGLVTSEAWLTHTPVINSHSILLSDITTLPLWPMSRDWGPLPWPMAGGPAPPSMGHHMPPTGNPCQQSGGGLACGSVSCAWIRSSRCKTM